MDLGKVERDSILHSYLPLPSVDYPISAHTHTHMQSANFVISFCVRFSCQPPPPLLHFNFLCRLSNMFVVAWIWEESGGRTGREGEDSLLSGFSFLFNNFSIFSVVLWNLWYRLAIIIRGSFVRLMGSHFQFIVYAIVSHLAFKYLAYTGSITGLKHIM